MNYKNKKNIIKTIFTTFIIIFITVVLGGVKIAPDFFIIKYNFYTTTNLIEIAL